MALSKSEIAKSIMEVLRDGEFEHTIMVALIEATKNKKWGKAYLPVRVEDAEPFAEIVIENYKKEIMECMKEAITRVIRYQLLSNVEVDHD